jgi:transposase
MEKRYIGIDLQRNRFTCCIRLENERTYVTEWDMEKLAQFVKKLRSSDELAVEITSNTRLFYDAVAPQVARVVVVDTNQFRVISQSVKKTDPNDARLLSLYLSKGLLPEVRMKNKELAQLASLTQTRDTLVKQRSALKNKVNNILSARGLNLAKEALSSEKKLAEVLALPFDEVVRVELRVIVEQIRNLNKSITELEKTIGEEGSKLEGHQCLSSIKGIGKITGDFAERDWRGERLSRRGPPGQLLRHCAPRVELERYGAKRPDSQAWNEAGANGTGAIGPDRSQLQPLLEAVLRTSEGTARCRQSYYRAGAQVSWDHLPNLKEQMDL